MRTHYLQFDWFNWRQFQTWKCNWNIHKSKFGKQNSEIFGWMQPKRPIGIEQKWNQEMNSTVAQSLPNPFSMWKIGTLSFKISLRCHRFATHSCIWTSISSFYIYSPPPRLYKDTSTHPYYDIKCVSIPLNFKSFTVQSLIHTCITCDYLYHIH